jgi:hypothetical protein
MCVITRNSLAKTRCSPASLSCVETDKLEYSMKSVLLMGGCRYRDEEASDDVEHRVSRESDR